MYRVIFYVLIALFPYSLCWSGDPQTPRNVSITTADGGLVDVLIRKRGRHGVILAHGAIFNKESWEAVAKALSDRGFTTLALDFRGYGRSKSGSRPGALYEDILASVRYLRQQDTTIVSVVGASMGAGATAKAAINANTGEIDQLILLSPVPIAHPEKLKGDVLFMASEFESMVDDIKAMFEKTSASKKLVILPGRAHAQHIFKTDQSEKLIQEMIQFLAKTKTKGRH